ncbi:sensor histidine kinase [Flavobacterium stagni]|uniref:histidine kinase n=1 Tax=Flavobacterium stagni TaxID=2506421 RepID=A0A4Q1KC63_9FLAO|nr:HAMP domain-containing sensor histidine kinase [Flavobacterium stagni]RXR24497.1 HAMP domain-containing histidine kinase [Flavobacterium stagni]
MTLKRKIAINVSIAFSILFGLAATYIYISFSNFRKEEFKDRLTEKALTTAKLLLEVKEIDNTILKLIDQNTINKLYNEKTLVFDGQYKLVYQSLDDSKIKYTKDDLVRLNNEKSFYKVNGDQELLGIYLPFENTDYYVLISAQDKYGYSKMQYLLYSLIITYIISITLVWLLTYFFIKKLLQPLDEFQKTITTISANALNIHLVENQSHDEINLLTKAFNQMLNRLEFSFNTQKEFTSNASHELYTPLTRISLQLENLMNAGNHPPETEQYLKNINNDVHQMADLINSLLLLAKLNQDEIGKKLETLRVDDLVFDAYSQMQRNFPDFTMHFELEDNEAVDNAFEIHGFKSLLQIVIVNLLKNAYLYSEDKKATVLIQQPDASTTLVTVKNSGKTLTAEEQHKLFQPFARGENSANIHGSGLGLRIVKRILDFHGAEIQYTADGKTNQFQIVFSA